MKFEVKHLSGVTLTLDMPDDQVPTEELASMFGEMISKVIKERPWDGAPPHPVAVAWSIASVAAHASEQAADEEFDSDVIKEIAIETLEGFYTENTERTQASRKH